MIIKSSTSNVSANIETVKSFLSDPRNLERLLPADRISQFEANEESCSFVVQGGINISLLLDQQHENTICYRSGAGSPFPFMLNICLTAQGVQTAGYVLFDGEINGFLKLMVEKPLKSLFEGMIERLQALY